MATRVTWELTGEERRKLARDLMAELVVELEEALLDQREKQAEATNRDELKNLIREVLLETLWEVEQHLPDPDEELALHPEAVERLQTAHEEQTVSLEAVRKELGLDE
jgi:predicted house-cleaning noncanonical NTP pyrophosphatase (MazG superfamily)